MSIRTIKYSVTENGINPVSRQFGGIQGEHNVTKVIFDLSAELHAKIWEHMYSQGAKIVYRFDGIDGVGGKISTDTEEIGFEDSAPGGVRSFEYLLSHDITKEGGTVQVFLIITSILNDETQAELYNFPATLYLKDKTNGTPRDKEDYESISTLAENTKGAAQRAEVSADEAQQSAEAAEIAQQKTEESMMALEAGSTIIFQGGNAGSRFTVDIAVDDELSKESENPVQNRKVFKRFEELISALIQAKLDAHPIGSLYWSSKPTEPSELFGGEWKRVKDKFILAAGDEYKAGESGGESEVILDEKKMPKHRHEGIQWIESHNVSLNSGDVDADGYALSWEKGILETSSNFNTGYAGEGQPHNNMPPYEVYYCWERTA